jgi:hypothetical protein
MSFVAMMSVFLISNAGPIDLSGIWKGVCDNGTHEFVAFSMTNCSKGVCQKLQRSIINEDGTPRTQEAANQNREWLIGVRLSETQEDLWGRSRASASNCQKKVESWSYANDFTELHQSLELIEASDLNECRSYEYTPRGEKSFEAQRGLNRYSLKSQASKPVLVQKSNWEIRRRNHRESLERTCTYLKHSIEITE